MPVAGRVPVAGLNAGVCPVAGLGPVAGLVEV